MLRESHLHIYVGLFVLVALLKIFVEMVHIVIFYVYQFYHELQ